MKRSLILALAFALISSLSLAASLTGPIGCGGAGWPLSNLTGPMLCGGGAPPPTCTGTIDLSTGCVQPMIR